MREIMNKEQLAEYLGIKVEDLSKLFPAPPTFKIVGYEKYKLSEIKEWLDEIIDSQHQTKSREAKIVYKNAQNFLIEKNYKKAADNFKKAIALDRTEPDYHFNYGFSLYHLDELDLAETEMRKALEQNPKGDWRDAAKHHIELIEKRRFEERNKKE